MTRLAIHPGQILQEEYIDPLGLTIDRFADILHISAIELKDITTSAKSITGDLAIRLGRALTTRPQMWLGLQANYDLAQAKSTMLDIIHPII